MLFISKYSILIILYVTLNSVAAESAASLLPKPGECGKLNIEYFHNESASTALDEFPWIGQVMADYNETELRPICLTVLIGKRHLLANANCIQTIEGTPVAVILGDWNATNAITEPDCDANGKCAPLPQKFEIDKVTVHPASDRKQQTNNMAVIRLKSEVVFSDFIQPICLPTAARQNEDYVGQYLPYAGFRRYFFWKEVEVTRTIKTKNLAHIVSLQRCRQKYGKYDDFRVNIGSSHICATCSQDSPFLNGSPLMGFEAVDSEPHHFYLIGLLTYGSLSSFYSCIEFPDVFTRISEHLNWIIENIN